ncbi:MAG: T9SS type A sorting domain-containing protein [Ignavibacteria bacterium]|nr:T9SS type A sorting domain-containing protein [Ignavibacteria bacterium]
MKPKFAFAISLSLPFFIAYFFITYHHNNDNGFFKEQENLDNDWFITQRSFPREDIPFQVLENAKSEMNTRFANKKTSGMWTLAGPTNIGGRITSLIIHPTNENIFFAGSASGGVWKTTDNGNTWTNIFNEHFSIGALSFDPTNPNCIYVGTGEANPAGVATYPGNGVWKTTNGGETWANIGLESTGHIGKIVVNPNYPQEIFVAALGLYRGKTQERGVFKSSNGGANWNRVLFLNDTTGATDIVFHPMNSSRMFAAMWTRYRTPRYSVISGVASGLFLSTNGGENWTQVTAGFPNNDENLGRISLAISSSNPNTIFALVADGVNVKGVYKSTNGGNDWHQVNDGAEMFESQVWYNNIIVVHPTNANVVWLGMTSFYKSTNGGTSFSDILSFDVHVDQHAMEYAPSNPNKIVLGNDGGIFVSTNGGTSWNKSLNLPITQFYAGTIDFQFSNKLLGGTQDNGTLRTSNSTHSSWSEIYGGDGFYCLVDPTDSNFVYAEYQNGGLGFSTDGGNSFEDGTNGIGANDRFNWSTPIAMDLQHPKTLYVGTQRVYRTKDNMQNWTAISGDLTYGNGGRVGTISTIDVSQTDSNVIYVGTDDSRVWVTTNGGTNWVNIDDSLPNRWATRVSVDPESANIAYVTLSGFNVYDFGGHIFRTTNFGATWSNIGESLPDIPINDVIVDEQNRSHLYIATDLNVMFTTNVGETWNILGENFPDVSVHDLTLHSPTRKLVAFTHGRSAFSYNIIMGAQEISNNIPSAVSLSQNYPNPFNPKTTIGFSMLAISNVTLKVFDILGREMATLLNNETKEAGKHEVEFDASALTSGMYVYRIFVTQHGKLCNTETKKFVVLK